MQPLRYFLILVFLLLLPPSSEAAPTVSTRIPAIGATVNSLTSVSVTFSEAVTGVDATDFIVNGDAAIFVTGANAGPYVFTFTQPLPGLVNVSFESDHGIVGQSGSGAFGGGAWSYTLIDTVAPTVALTTPATTATVGALIQVEVTFSEIVTGVDAADLTVNGTPATGLTRSGFGPYVFTFAQPAVGTVNFAWAAGHGIVDTAAAPNALAGGTWSVTLSAAGPGTVVINEFLAANGTGLVDEDTDPSDWIELKNTGASAVNLAGWSLTNDSGELGRWVFPSRTIAAGGYLVVYASGKNRKPVSGNLHTNFTINENGGYLALVGPQSPRVAVSAFNYPEQRTDYSYGPQLSDGALRYFGTTTVPATAPFPTPNAANHNSTLMTITSKVNVSVSRGFFKDAFQLVLSCPDAGTTIRYTSGVAGNFSEPTATTGAVYSGPITISATMCVRAVAYATGKVTSLPVTHTYIFLDQLLSQGNTPAGFPTTWGTYANFTSNIIPADYEMDTDPLRVDPLAPASAVDAVKLQRFKDGMRELPLVSIVIPVSDIFTSTGLYYGSTVAAQNNVENKNFGYRKCSVEMILPDGSSAFSVTCGLSGHGNASRTPSKNPKHGFQIKFKGDYGPGSLDFPIFTDSQVAKYDDIILRPDFGSSWRHWSDGSYSLGNFQRTRATRTRDAFIKSTFHDMGWLASHHRFVHLYIDGIYWGVYDFAEQPVEGFISAYMGGAKADYSIIHEGNAKNGTDATYTNMTGMGAITSNALYDQMKGYLDVTQFIDYHVMQFYVGALDWGNTKNWYAFRRRSTTANPSEGKYQYVPWDEENTLLDTTTDRVNSEPVVGYGLPSGVHAKLVSHAQYKLDFADRVHKHLIAPGGALSSDPLTVGVPESAPIIARWLKWQAILDKPIVAESCRWGDYRRDVHPFSQDTYALYTRESHWLAENTRMTGAGGYFRGRTATLLDQLRSAGLYPAATSAAPEYRLNTTGGTIVGTSQIASGSVIAMNRPGGAGVIYFTTDGNDPHIYYMPTTGATGTSVAATAQTYSAPITINATTTVKSRILNGGVWSALNEATFAAGIGQPAVKITEIMYNPPGGSAYEFIELQNTGANAVNLGAWYFDAVDYYFPPGTLLGPGDRLVLGNNDGASGLFTARYPGVIVFGYFGGSLDNSGETITLHDANGRTVVSVTYDDTSPWPTTPDGGGYSLEIIDANGNPDSYANWKASDVLNGTAGQANSTPPASVLVLNEVLAVNTGGVLVGGLPLGYVELKNTGGVSIDPAGWKIETTAGSYTFGSGAGILPGDFAVVACGVGSGIPNPLNGAGGVVRLRNPAGAYVDAISFGNQIADRAIGRVGSAWTLTDPTVSADNAAASLAPPAGNLVINEWLSNAAPGSTDWMELYNKHATQPVAISGLFFQTDTQLYRYPSLSFVAPLGWLQLFCDEQPGFDQLDFRLPATGTPLSILDSAATVIDTVSAANFGAPAQGVSRGRTTDGSATFSTFSGSASPGAANYVNSWTGPIINEVLARNSAGDIAPWGTRADWVELYNPLATSVFLDGMKLGTANQTSGAWIFPAGTSIPALGYLYLWCDAGRSASLLNESDMNTALNLGDQSGALYFFNTNGQIVNRVEWGPQIVDRSFGLDSGVQKLLANPTRGALNSAASALSAVTSLKINEWFAMPVVGGDWFETFNPGVNPVNMAGLYLSDDPGELGRAKFTVPALSFIAAGSWVKWEADAVPEAGRNHVNFNLDGNAEYLRLSNNDANLTPIDTISFGQQLNGVAQGRIADGGSVQLLLAPTPGASNTVLLAPTIQAPPANTTAIQGTIASFIVIANSAAPVTYQWRFNLGNIANANSSLLSLSNVAPANEGGYSVVVTNAAGSTPSSAGTLTVQSTFAQWAAARGISGSAADSDGDGISNIAEFFHNLDPLTVAGATDRAALPQFALEPPTGTPLFLTLTYRINARAALGGIGYQTSNPLASPWGNVAPDAIENLTPDAVTGDPRVRMKFSIAPGETKKFLRLQLTQ